MLRVEKGYGAKRLMADVSRRNWSLAAMKRLLQKIDLWWVMLFTNYRKNEETRLDAFEMKGLRRMLRVSYMYFSKVKADLYETM